MYNGKEEVAGTGLYAYGFRYYDPIIGRFTGVDPIADQFAHLSTFNYASNDPISNIDLHGLQGVNFGIGMMIAQKKENGATDAELDIVITDAVRGANYGLATGLAFGGAVYGGAVIGAPYIGKLTMEGVKQLGLKYTKNTLINLTMEASESFIFGENHDLSGIDYFDALNPIKGFRGNLMNATFNIDESGAGINGLKDGIIEFAAGEAGSFIGRKLQGRGAELLEKSGSIGNYKTLFPMVNPATGRRNFGMSVSKATQQASDAKAGLGLLKRGGNQGTAAGTIMENILKSF